MRRSPWHSLAVMPLVLAVACSRPADRPADQSAAADEAGAGEAQAIVTVLYPPPKDSAAFEAYYRDTHLPLVEANQAAIGFTKVELTKFTSAADGTPPTFYRQAELYFNSLDDARRGLATPAFAKVAADLQNFATGGTVAMLAVEMGERGTPPCPALFTVIYETPEDTAAFERYYGTTHLPLVGEGKNEIGFVRADLTRFVENLDGSPAAKYRQAELCFNSMDELRRGAATAAFKRVGDDLKNFATGGLTALVGEQP